MNIKKVVFCQAERESRYVVVDTLCLSKRKIVMLIVEEQSRSKNYGVRERGSVCCSTHYTFSIFNAM